MESLSHLSELSHLIQLAVAPVFLLAGVAGFLNVITGRLGRIVDRHRVVQRRSLSIKDPEILALNDRELQVLLRRIRLNNWSIGFCTLSGLLICVVVVTLFAGSYWSIAVVGGIVILFVLAMLSLIVALLLFIRETHLATQTLRVATEHLDAEGR
ncbi:DUF2721 domain-containing protein [Ketobacter sp. MCCC 1A13808]|uniref:DUF2721 domain-containing protein n=1 Tax=Ketobacter sp. MCCC 1A13808 TaxID=2602738 RepID=UPI000F18AA24|nr:DUF2721 domain-containing protein [Ketobacter sp. MCCC 1A13808]MVF11962.1 DUF2721 domain-containing protein [Ketobacter sp. MCCC 1A13808]RLP52907.1 MAG: DUF2721 domain-containing protein [Ketobacter sp.]